MSTPETNLSGTDTATALTPPASGIASRSLLQTLTVLIRRELWEHRSLWMVPLVISGLLVVCAFLVHIGAVPFGEDGIWSHGQSRGALLALGQWALSVPEYLVMLIVLTFYLLDCLYAERKDRSILFWKSMPASDGVTVASKLLTALVVIPLGVYALALVTSLLFWAILAVRASFGALPPLKIVWDTVAWLKVEALMLFGVFVSMFWYAPFAAYLVLVSAWARRSVYLWASLPPLFAIILERFAFGTHYVTEFIHYRTFGIWDALNPEYAAERTVTDGHHSFISLPGMFDTLNVTQPFLNIDLWLGVAVAAGLAFAAARIRRYRDDT
jgi:ABC-2 type transport system permease protein